MASVPWGKAPWAQPAAAAAELRAEGGPPLRLHPSVEGGEGLGELVEHVGRGTGGPGSGWDGAPPGQPVAGRWVGSCGPRWTATGARRGPAATGRRPRCGADVQWWGQANGHGWGKSDECARAGVATYATRTATTQDGESDNNKKTLWKMD